MDSITMTTEQQLPKGWEIKRLGDVLKIQNGYAFKSVEFIKENPKNTHIPLIRQSQLVGNTVDLSDCVFLDKKYLSDKKNYIVNKGDILIGMSGSIGKVSFYEDERPALLNQRVGKLNLYNHDTFQKDFFAYLLINLEQSIIQTAKGMGVQNISSKDIEQLQIPIPPFDTQQAIVNKIESLFDEIDEGIGRLKTAAQQIQQYRQSLLKNAFNGELTKEWRSKHADTLPSENELLAQIQTTREQHHAQQLADWQTAVSQWEQNGKEGKKPSKPSTLKKLESIEKLNEIELTELPDGWFWERLGLMTLGVEYGTSAKSQPEGKVPVLRMGNMQNGKIDWTDLVYSDNDEEIKQYSLKKGDVLFNRTNSPELVGKTSIIETDEKAIFAGYLIRINHLTEITDGRYLTYFLNSMIAKKYGNFVKTDGVNQSNINGQKLINYPFVFCSLEEQKEVANILEQKLTACDQLAAELAKQLKQAELLKQTVLKAAFSGSLLDK
jgi:type I restriction-modification system specificity subunit